MFLRNELLRTSNFCTNSLHCVFWGLERRIHHVVTLVPRLAGASERQVQLVELIAICLADLFHRPVHAELALFDPDGAVADALDLLDGVADE